VFVLGVDPGETTGVALIEERPDGSLHLHDTLLLGIASLPVIVRWVNNRTDCAVVETWEYQGPKRARGVAYQAYAAGRAVGVLMARGFVVLEVTRTQALAAIGFTRGKKATKAAVAAWVRKLVPAISPEVGAAARSEHEWDAVAVAVAGLGVERRARLAGAL